MHTRIALPSPLENAKANYDQDKASELDLQRRLAASWDTPENLNDRTFEVLLREVDEWLKKPPNIAVSLVEIFFLWSIISTLVLTIQNEPMFRAQKALQKYREERRARDKPQAREHRRKITKQGPKGGISSPIHLPRKAPDVVNVNLKSVGRGLNDTRRQALWISSTEVRRWMGNVSEPAQRCWW